MSTEQGSNSAPHEIQVDAIWLATQLATIQSELSHVRQTQQTDTTSSKERDKVTEKLKDDMAEVKADIRQLKESKTPKVHPMVWVAGIVGTAGFVLSLFNQLYIR